MVAKGPRKARCGEAYERAWANRWLILKVLKDFRGIPYDRDQCFTVGLDALCGCFENYAPAKGSGFAAYASHSVKLAIKKSIAKDTPIHIPEWTRKLAVECIHGHRQLASIPERTKESRHARACVADAIAVMTKTRVPLDDPEYRERHGLPEACEPDEPTPLSPRMRAALDRLPQLERRAIDLAFGLNEDGACLAPREVAAELGYTYPSDATRIENRAIARLRGFLTEQGGGIACGR